MPQISYQSLAASGVQLPKSIRSTMGRMHFDSRAERYLEQCRLHGKLRTLVSYELALRHFGAVAGSVRIGAITTADIDRFVAAERKRGAEPGGTNNRLRAIKACLRWAVAEKLLGEVPCRIRMLRVPEVVGEKALGREDVDRLLAAAGPRDRALIRVSAATGLRIAEVLHLKWRELSGDQLRVSSNPEVDWTTKNHAERLVFLPARVLSSLHADSPARAFEQLALMVLQAGLGLGRSEILAYVRSAIDVVVQVCRAPDGRRQVAEVEFLRG